MSDQKRSWDKKVSPGNGVAYHHESDIRDLSPARLIQWPDGAPDRSEVPHAGDKVRTKGGGVSTVQSGIPYQYQDYKWYLRLYYEGKTSGGTTAMRLENIRPYTPEPERTYTADQIEEAFTATAYGSAAALIKRMDL